MYNCDFEGATNNSIIPKREIERENASLAINVHALLLYVAVLLPCSLLI